LEKAAADGQGILSSLIKKKFWSTENQEEGEMTKNILNADALRPKFIRLYSRNGTYGVYVVFADQSDVPQAGGAVSFRALDVADSENGEIIRAS
jgi:hypothetical protein